VSDVMQTNVPSVIMTQLVPAALSAMTQGGMGMVIVYADATNTTPFGIFTDGDLRRAMARLGDLRTIAVSDVMTPNPRRIEARRLAVEAVEMMEMHKVNQLVAVDDQGKLCGALNMHDLFRAKVV
jgi:arabinose-5-phosphate isomerase